ncbi:MAG: amino acid racemase [Candidatus Bipolaricaulota bacterium]
MAPKVVGVIGGMGPAATAEFFVRLTAATPATRDEDHLRVLIDSDPRIPSRSDAILHGGASPAPRLCEIAQELERAGAEILAMPCNTAHAYLEAMRRSVSVPVLDMPAEAAARLDVARVGVLATEASVRAGVFERALAARGIESVRVDEEAQAAVADVIVAVKAGRPIAPLREVVGRLVAELARRGAEAVIIGCTEISVVGVADAPIPGFDALDALVAATVREALEGERG